MKGMETTKPWISIKKNRPKEGLKVLVKWKDSDDKKNVDTGKFWWYHPKEWRFTIYDVGGSRWLDDSEVTHWKPLPK